ncbi:MAG: DNA/RNA nuclease SfsA, partial [Verrucomicrobia bacterium]|nr:DNA/RNA nuclease SfsA [Verrucomicrobiota bacterium]
RTEVPCGKNSRIDFLLTNSVDPPCYVEVKNVHLNLNGKAAFPDAITTRGTKHLLELIALKEQGYRAIMVYIVQRSDLGCFTVAEEIDPVYADTLKRALHLGVEAFCYRCNVSTQGISLGSSLPFNL